MYFEAKTKVINASFFKAANVRSRAKKTIIKIKDKAIRAWIRKEKQIIYLRAKSKIKIIVKKEKWWKAKKHRWKFEKRIKKKIIRVIGKGQIIEIT